jgi:hypothetical protein
MSSAAVRAAWWGSEVGAVAAEDLDPLGATVVDGLGDEVRGVAVTALQSHRSGMTFDPYRQAVLSRVVLRPAR